MAAERSQQQNTENREDSTAESPIEYPAMVMTQDSFRLTRSSADEPHVNTIDLREVFYYSV
jgi:hypothetical protein